MSTDSQRIAMEKLPNSTWWTIELSPDFESAKKLRDEYLPLPLDRQGLTVAEQEGRFPPTREGTTRQISAI
jgi:hypothetical protein